MLLSCFTGCTSTEEPSQTVEGTSTPTDSATDAPDDELTTPVVSDGVEVTPTPALSPEETFFLVSASPDPLAIPTAPLSPTPTPTPTPVPTPTPTLRPAQKDSIVPAELLTTGYTKPLDPKCLQYDFPRLLFETGGWYNQSLYL